MSSTITSSEIQKSIDSALSSYETTLSAIKDKVSEYEASQDDWDAIRDSFSALQSALKALQDDNTFYGAKTTSSDETLVTAEVGDKAIGASYTFSNIVLGTAAQKISGSLGLSSSGHGAVYQSTDSVADLASLSFYENMSDLSEWTLKPLSATYSIAEQTTFDGRSTMHLQNTAAWGGEMYSSAEVDTGSATIANFFNLSTSLYFEELGTYSNAVENRDNAFGIHVSNDSFELDMRFGSNGLMLMTDSGAVEIGTDVVAEGEWNDWSVDVTDNGDGTYDVLVLKDGTEVGTAAGVSKTPSHSDGNVYVIQSSFSKTGSTYLDSLNITPQSNTDLVDENLVLDGSEGVTGIAGEISDGYFKINGQEINVDITKDTLMEVISKINAADVGVTASWDTTNDKLILTADETGEDIKFDEDTSGFLAAMKINTSAASSEPIDNAWERELDQVSTLAGISDGYFTINGITFSVDTSTDSLEELLNEINESDAGVTAYYSEALDKVVMTAKDKGENIEYSNDTSNFLSTIMGDLETAQYTAGSVDVDGITVAMDGDTLELGDAVFSFYRDSNQSESEKATVTVSRDTETATKAIETFVESYNSLRDVIDEKKEGNLSGDRTLNNLKASLRTYVVSEFSNNKNFTMLRDVGIKYDDGRLTLDKSDLEELYSNSSADIASLFAYDGDGDGIRDEGGFATDMLDDLVKDLTKSYSGDIYRRRQILADKIERMKDEYDEVEADKEKKEDSLWDKYTAYAQRISAMNAQYTSVTSMLAASASSSSSSSLYDSSWLFSV